MSSPPEDPHDRNGPATAAAALACMAWTVNRLRSPTSASMGSKNFIAHCN